MFISSVRRPSSVYHAPFLTPLCLYCQEMSHDDGDHHDHDHKEHFVQIRTRGPPLGVRVNKGMLKFS